MFSCQLQGLFARIRHECIDIINQVSSGVQLNDLLLIIAAFRSDTADVSVMP